MSETPATLSDAEQRALRSVVAHIVPASAQYAVPGADDAVIFADIVASLGRDTHAVRQALARIAELAGGEFADLSADRQQQVLSAFRDGHAAAAGVLYAVTVQCYYRDDRVLASIGLEPRAPFPKGYTVPAGDLSLLDPVRARGPIYRNAT
ncbi:MAG: gluconate 2-dehydrogenase subunit 3 family protein [Hyphomicrobiaceae bacterium]